jgi:hypothetical protein
MAQRQVFKQTIPAQSQATPANSLFLQLLSGQPPSAPLLSPKEAARRKRRRKMARTSRARNL